MTEDPKLELDPPLAYPEPMAGGAEMVISNLQVGAQSQSAWLVEHALTPKEADRLHRDVMGRPFQQINQDSEATEFVRHLTQFIDNAPTPESIANHSPAITHAIGCAKRMLGDIGLKWTTLSRVYANCASFGEYQHVHTDGDVWTILFFVNSRWHTDWGGELSLYHDLQATVATTIRPRPGRVVIFDGDIPHRAGVPSKYCPDPRITLAIKFKRN